MLVRELYEAEKAATLAFGRMNPPTIGHKKLVDVVASQQGDPFLFITQTQKPKTDPLDFQTKLKFAKQFFPNVTVGDSSVNTIIKALQKLESLGYTSITYVAGSDRVDDFKELITKYNGKEYNFKNIQVVSAGERDPDADGAEGMSASKMRAAAMSDDFDSFKQGVIDQKLANALYDAVRKGMGITERELTKGEEKEKERIVKGMKKTKSSFKKRYGKDADAVMYATATKLAKNQEDIAELKVAQQRPKIDVLTNISARKDQNPWPLSYKDTGDMTASSGGKIFIGPKEATKFINFYDTRAEDEQELMQKALKTFQGAQNLFKNLGIRVQVEEVSESQKDTHCSDKCCGSDVTREDCKCSPDCEHCNCNDDSIPEGDLVLDRSALIAHLQREIEKFASQETDVEKLSFILKQLSGQKVKTRNKKYFTVTDEDILEGIKKALKNLKGPG
jgi:nicotinic acid mononucleotide adenylyltransferase